MLHEEPDGNHLDYFLCLFYTCHPKKVHKGWFCIKMSEVRIKIGKMVKGLDILLKFIVLNDFLRNLAKNSMTHIRLHR